LRYIISYFSSVSLFQFYTALSLFISIHIHKYIHKYLPHIHIYCIGKGLVVCASILPVWTSTWEEWPLCSLRGGTGGTVITMYSFCILLCTWKLLHNYMPFRQLVTIEHCLSAINKMCFCMDCILVKLNVNDDKWWLVYLCWIPYIRLSAEFSPMLMF